MDEMLILYGQERHCDDCDAFTIFLPLEDDVWVCTSCDAGIVVPVAA